MRTNTFAAGCSRLAGADAGLDCTTPARLSLVEKWELEALRTALNRGALPSHFESKLRRLAQEGLTHYFIEHTSRIFIAMWLAARRGGFLRCQPEHLDLMLKVLAYVDKENDFIPDDHPGGYTDDYEIIRNAGKQLETFVKAFKEWRLKNQVPRIWLEPQPDASARWTVSR